MAKIYKAAVAFQKILTAGFLSYVVVPIDRRPEGLLPFLPQPDDKKVDALQPWHTQLYLHGTKGQAVTMVTTHLGVL